MVELGAFAKCFESIGNTLRTKFSREKAQSESPGVPELCESPKVRAPHATTTALDSARMLP
jgi:hypothetical protein